MSDYHEPSIANQPNFPEEDLSYKNERMLYGILTHDELRTSNYMSAARSQSPFRAAADIFDLFEQGHVLDERTTRGFIIGAQAMMAMCHLVNPGLEAQHTQPSTYEVHEVLSKNVSRVLNCLDLHARRTETDTPYVASALEGVTMRNQLGLQAVLSGAGVIRYIGQGMLTENHKPIATTHE